MKNFKKLAAIVMGTTLIMSSTIMASADDIKSEDTNTIHNSEVTGNYINKMVKIKSVTKEDGDISILITPIEDNASDVVLKISTGTHFIDNLNQATDFVFDEKVQTTINSQKEDLALEDVVSNVDLLKEGDVIFASYSKAMTRSIPPQSNANVIYRNVDTISDEPATLPQVQKTVEMNAVVKSTTDGEYKSILVEDINQEGFEVSLNVDEETIIIKADGTPVNFADIKADDKIKVIHSMAMTFSLPPQTYAYAIIVSNDEVATPTYIEVAKVETSDDITTITSADGNYIIRVNKDTEITPFKTRNIVTANDIKEGSILFAWYDIMTASLPAQANANKVMLLPEKVDLDVTDVKNVVINGENVDLGDNKIETMESHVMLPVRAVAGKLGFDITWDATTNTANLDNGAIEATITLGTDSYYKAQSKTSSKARTDLLEVFECGVAPTFINGSLYVPAELFNSLYTDNSTEPAVTVKNGVVNINNIIVSE